MIKLCMVNITRTLEEESYGDFAKIVMQIHDELLLVALIWCSQIEF